METIADKPRDKTVLELQQERMFALSGAERIQACDFFETMRTHIENQIRSEAPEIDDRELAFRTAERIHMANPKALASIAAMRRQ